MINLMPPKQKQDIKFGSYNVNIIQYSILVIAIGLALASVITFGIQIVRSDENTLNKSIAQKELQLTEYEDDNVRAVALTKKIDTISSLLKDEVKFSELIQEIGGLLPNGARLTGLQLTSDLSEPLVLVAVVDSKTVATQLQQNLANSDLFIGADIQSLNPANTDEASGRILDYSVKIVVAFPQAEEGGTK